VLGAAGVPQQAAEARVAVAGPQQAAEARVAVAELQQAAARDAAEVRLRAAPGAQAALPSVLPSALAFRQDQVPPWPVPQPAARSAHATEYLRIERP